jgi:alpha-galactosidase
MKILRFALLLPALAAGVHGSELKFTYEEAGVWTLRNGSAQAVFELDHAGRFGLRSFEDLKTGDTWAPPAGRRTSPIRLRVNGETFDADTAFQVVDHSSGYVPRFGQRQTIELQDSRGRGRVAVELELYEGQPVLRYRVRYRNLAPNRVTVQRADMLPWSLDDRLRTVRAFRVNQWVNYGKSGNFETLISTLGRGGSGVTLRTGAYGQHCAWLAFRDSTDRGLMAGLEFDGRAVVNLRQTTTSLELSADIEELNRPLAAGEEFTGPWAFIGMFRGDWDDAGWVTQRFTEAAIAQPVPSPDFPYVIWDSWKYQTDFDQDTLRRNAEIAARLGVEVFVVDLGWSRHIGDWREDPRKFSLGGLRALSDYVRSLGMKFGLHFAFAEAAAQSPVLQQNPDWTSSETYGYFEAESICLSHSPVREWVAAEAIRMIDEYGVDWILQDGENMVKRCTKTTHTHSPMDSNYSNAVDGLNWVVETVQQARPDTLWENCEDGGNMMTFNMLRNYVTSIAADDSGPLTTRQAIFGITYPFSPRYANRYMPDEALHPYVTRSFMFGGPWIFMNRLEWMQEEDLAFAASEIALYKRIRRQIREGRVFHLTGRPSETGIDALQSYHPETDHSIVFVFRAASGGAARTLRLRGLTPERRYQVSYEDGSGPPAILTGAQLMQGFTVRLPGRWSTHLIYVDPVDRVRQS